MSTPFAALDALVDALVDVCCLSNCFASTMVPTTFIAIPMCGRLQIAAEMILGRWFVAAT